MEIVCSGMERSGSTVAWQKVQFLLGKPCSKTHLYVTGQNPVLYTYRHPAEAYISFRDRLTKIYPTSVAKSHARERIEKQQEVFHLYNKDFSSRGRDVLMLKYEDYYYDSAKRLKDIAAWLGLDCDETVQDDILLKTSIEKNMTNGHDFSHFDNNTGLHGTHINPVTKGKPGALLDLIDDDPYLSSSALRLLCKKFGYSY